MNKETGKLYGEFFDNWINKFIPDKGDNRLEVEYALHKLIKSIKKNTVNECIEKVNAIKPNKIITELKLHWCIIEELKSIRDNK